MPKELSYKAYDLAWDEQLNGTSEIIDKYDKYVELTKKQNIPAEYNEEYFKTKFLVAIYVGMNENEVINRVGDPKVVSNELLVDIKSSLGDSKTSKTTLIFLETRLHEIDEIKRINIVKNEEDITKIDTSLAVTYDVFSYEFLHFDGLVKVISSFDEFDKFNKTVEFAMFDDYLYDEEYFRLNSVIAFYFNYNSSRKDINVKTSVSENKLFINVDSSLKGEFTRSFIGIIRISNNYLNKLEDIRLFKDDEDITESIEMLYPKFLRFEGTIDGNYCGNFRVVNNYDELLEHKYLDKIIDTYQDFDFKNKSLILLRTSSSTPLIYSETWYEKDGDTLNIYMNYVEQSPLCVVEYYIMAVEISKELLQDVSNIQFNRYDHFDKKFYPYSSNEYDSLLSGFYQYSNFKTEYKNDYFKIVSSYKGLVDEIGSSMASNYFVDFFEKGRVLIYFYDLPKNYLQGVPEYRVEGNTLYIDIMYIELDNEQSRFSERYVMINLSKELLDMVTDISLVLEEYNNNQ